MDNRGFALAVGLREISIGPGNRLRPTYVSAKSNPEYKPKLIDLLKVNLKIVLLNEMLGLDRLII